jgi:hypothetical protein
MQFLTDCQADATANLVYRACPPVPGAIGIKPEVAQGFLVFTLNHRNREETVHYVLSHQPPEGDNLRAFFPVWRQKMTEAAGSPR